MRPQVRSAYPKCANSSSPAPPHRATTAKYRREHPRPLPFAATGGSAGAGAPQSGTHKSERSRPAESFEAVLQPLDVLKVLHFLKRGGVGYVDARQWGPVAVLSGSG